MQELSFELINESLKNYGVLVYCWKVILKWLCIIYCMKKNRKPSTGLTSTHAQPHAELQ